MRRKTIALVDIFANGMCLFLALLILAIPLINPPDSEADAIDDPPGNLIVSVTWPPAMDVDVDTWLDSPAGDPPTGYTNQNSLIWNLLRDDMGNTRSDISGVNYESAYSRGVIDGWYRVNLHCFRCGILPVPVTVEIRLASSDDTGKKGTDVLFYTQLELVESHQELTAVAWRMQDGELQRGSVNNIFEPLRALNPTAPDPAPFRGR